MRLALLLLTLVAVVCGTQSPKTSRPESSSLPSPKLEPIIGIAGTEPRTLELSRSKKFATWKLALDIAFPDHADFRLYLTKKYQSSEREHTVYKLDENMLVLLPGVMPEQAVSELFDSREFGKYPHDKPPEIFIPLFLSPTLTTSISGRLRPLLQVSQSGERGREIALTIKPGDPLWNQLIDQKGSRLKRNKFNQFALDLIDVWKEDGKESIELESFKIWQVQGSDCGLSFQFRYGKIKPDPIAARIMSKLPIAMDRAFSDDPLFKDGLLNLFETKWSYSGELDREFTYSFYDSVKNRVVVVPGETTNQALKEWQDSISLHRESLVIVIPLILSPDLKMTGIPRDDHSKAAKLSRGKHVSSQALLKEEIAMKQGERAGSDASGKTEEDLGMAGAPDFFPGDRTWRRLVDLDNTNRKKHSPFNQVIQETIEWGHARGVKLRIKSFKLWQVIKLPRDAYYGAAYRFTVSQGQGIHDDSQESIGTDGQDNSVSQDLMELDQKQPEEYQENPTKLLTMSDFMLKPGPDPIPDNW